MAIYEYCCPEHGRFEVVRPGGTATDTLACRECGATAQRVMTAPAIRKPGNRNLYAALDRADKSRFEPEVVTSIPSAGNPRAPRMARMTPQLAGLPRP